MNDTLLEQLLEKTEEANRLRRRLSWVLVVCALLLVLLVGMIGWFAKEAQGIGDGVAQVGEMASKLDVEALEQSIQSLEQQLSSLDVDTLNETLRHISESAEHMEKAAEGFEAFGQGMGNLFGKRN